MQRCGVRKPSSRGSRLAINAGRFTTAGGVVAAGWLFGQTGGNYATIRAACALVYTAGMFVILGAPETRGELAIEQADERGSESPETR